MQFPLSRVLTCYKEGPEAPRTAACKAAIRASGKQAFYDWNGVRLADVAGRHRRRIPDGRLCSAGNPTFRGLDLPRSDWPATRVKSGARLDLRFAVTAPHKGAFQLFITKNGYDPAKPLKWADLDAKPFLTKNNPRAVNGLYDLTATIPAGKKGRHLIYAIWQRSDSPEAFYSCSDVVIGNTSASPGSLGTKSLATSGGGHGGHDHGGTTPGGQGHGAAVPKGHAHGGASPTSLHVVRTASDEPAGGGLFGAGLICGTVGLTLGGVAGLLLTARRRRQENDL
ncbi:chitin-binding protein [Actinomadura logoneensis]|uniref:Chitin-binding protein n=2 Tax=Actinomadura logoneensis TaxID=2293572 RepID=A0A372JFN4_9ACTN|nr:chitin-binding protein [Actinomadura logoneensis]